MTSHQTLFTVAFNLIFAQLAFAQPFTTVQLPTVKTFSMSTTVSVPDRGSVYAGGVDRSVRQSSQRGTPFLPRTNRNFGGSAASSEVWVSAHVHDLDELDHAVLNEWDQIKTSRQKATSRQTATSTITPRGTTLRDSDESRALDHRQPKVSDVRRAVQRVRTADYQRAMHDYRLGRRLESKQNFAAARVVYKNALRRADDDLKIQIVIRLKAIKSLRQVESPQLATRAAQSRR